MSILHHYTFPLVLSAGFSKIFSAMEKDTGTKTGRNILICTSMGQLAGCCYGNKICNTVFRFFQKKALILARKC